MTGIVLWYDKRIGYGVIEDATGALFYVRLNELDGLNYLSSKDQVSFEVNPTTSMPLYAHKVTFVNVCEGNNGVGKPGDACDAEGCQACCSHDERDHGICLDCGDEEDPGAAIDHAMDYWERDR